MSNQKIQLPAYANNPIYKVIDDAVTTMIVTIFDAINPKGIVLTDEQVKQFQDTIIDMFYAMNDDMFLATTKIISK